MTRPLALPENQVRAIIRAARKEGMRVELKIGEVVVTAIPDDGSQDKRIIDNDKRGHL